MLGTLHGLMDAGRFTAVDSEALRAIERAADSESVLDAASAPAGLIHSDLGGENVFVLRGELPGHRLAISRARSRPIWTWRSCWNRPAWIPATTWT